MTGHAALLPPASGPGARACCLPPQTQRSLSTSCSGSCRLFWHLGTSKPARESACSMASARGLPASPGSLAGARSCLGAGGWQPRWQGGPRGPCRCGVSRAARSAPGLGPALAAHRPAETQGRPPGGPGAGQGLGSEPPVPDAHPTFHPTSCRCSWSAPAWACCDAGCG